MRAFPFELVDFGSDRGNDGLRNLILQGEAVIEFAVLAFGPDMVTAVSLD